VRDIALTTEIIEHLKQMYKEFDELSASEPFELNEGSIATYFIETEEYSVEECDAIAYIAINLGRSVIELT